MPRSVSAAGVAMGRYCPCVPVSTAWRELTSNRTTGAAADPSAASIPPAAAVTALAANAAAAPLPECVGVVAAGARGVSRGFGAEAGAPHTRLLPAAAVGAMAGALPTARPNAATCAARWHGRALAPAAAGAGVDAGAVWTEAVRAAGAGGQWAPQPGELCTVCRTVLLTADADDAATLLIIWWLKSYGGKIGAKNVQ